MKASVALSVLVLLLGSSATVGQGLQGSQPAVTNQGSESVYSERSLYWTGTDQLNNRPAIFRLHLENSTIDTLVSSDSVGPMGVAVDTIRNQIYWTDSFELRSRIMRANDDGSGIEVVVDTHTCGIGSFADIELDLVSGLIIWSYTGDCLATDLLKANLDGSDFDNDLLKLPATIEEPDYIAVDPTRGYVYWDVFSVRPKGIGRTPYDGTSLESVLDGQAARGLELDPTSQDVYWTVGSSILRSNLEEPGVDTLFTSSGILTDLAVDLQEGVVYWIEPIEGLIRRARLDGSQVENLVSGASGATRLSLNFGGKVSVANERRMELPESGLRARSYPNPLRVSTRIEFELEKASEVMVEVYDALGRRVERVAAKHYLPGTSTIVWQTEGIPSGVYFCRILANGRSTSLRLVVQ